MSDDVNADGNAERLSKPGMGNDPQYQGLRDAFVSVYKDDDGDDNPHNDATINICISPGRVNLIGEHIDYSDGFVMPMAIQPHITIAFRRNNDNRLRLYSEQMAERGSDEIVEIDLDNENPRKEPSWANYLIGPAVFMKKRGEMIVGVDCYIRNTLPIGAGLSSSAALEVAMITTLLYASGGEMSIDEIAKLGQRAENEYVGMPCGIMDQTAVAGGKAGHAMLLDCRSQERTYVPLPPEDVCIIVTNSKTEHALTDGGYKKRREQCEEAAKILGVESLRDASMTQLDQDRGKLDETVYMRAKHAIEEIARVPKFAEAMRAGDYEKAGQLMYASHASLDRLYNVSTPELNALVEIAQDLDGVYGSRMTGAGFGGCTVTLAKPEKAEEIKERLAKAFEAKTKVSTLPFITKAVDGAKVID